MELLEQYRKLLHIPYEVRTIRASTLASYWWCSEKARLTALGVQSKTSWQAQWGTIVHNNITKSRNPSPTEQEFARALKPFYQTGDDGEPIICRAYKNSKIQADGQFLTHGADEWKVTPDHICWNIEYKTKTSNYITPVDLSPARFQTKLYCWLHAPIFELIKFTLGGAQIVFLQRKGKEGDFEPIGQTEYMHWNQETENQLLLDIERILWTWNNPDKQYPPKRWKCLKCPQIYKSKCFFQTGEIWKNGQQNI